MQLLLIIVPGVLNLSDCAGETDDRPAQPSGQYIDDNQNGQGYSCENKAVGEQQRTHAVHNIAVRREKQKTYPVSGLAVADKIFFPSQGKGEFPLYFIPGIRPGAFIDFPGDSGIAAIENHPILIQDGIAASLRNGNTGEHIFQLIPGHAHHHYRRAV